MLHPQNFPHGFSEAFSLFFLSLCFFADVDECDKNPCHNNGTCENFPGGFRCDCLDGATGDLCEVGEEFLLGDIAFLHLQEHKEKKHKRD